MAAATGDITRREMFAEIKKLCAPNNYTNIFVLVREYAVFACVTVCTAWRAVAGWPSSVWAAVIRGVASAWIRYPLA